MRITTEDFNAFQKDFNGINFVLNLLQYARKSTKKNPIIDANIEREKENLFTLIKPKKMESFAGDEKK